METGNHPIVLFSDALRIVNCDGPDWVIVRDRVLVDRSIGVVLHRPYHRIYRGCVVEKIQSEYVFAKIIGNTAAQSINILRTVKPGRQHKSALNGFLSLLQQMK